ncbi:MAG: UbiX family decarboxylase associated with menaquinone via futalosine [Ignavibacteriae bacterium]|nr:MAG: UbiX family decarboxylase associated with menaquinone via futalosine [Ignavibacteriota bacterium]
MKIAVGITGSSGIVYALEFLKKCPAEKYLVISKWGKAVLKDECGINTNELNKFVKKQFSNDDLTAPLASGTNSIDATVIIPCTTSTIGKIASGIGDSLLTRMAQVALKEKRKLILCIRETPLSTITLEQCAKLSRDGVLIMPISPPLYFKPNSVDEYIEAFVNKLNGVLGLSETKGWRSEELE